MVSTLLLFVNRLPEEAREDEYDKDMRKLVYLLGLLFFMACGEDAKEEIIPEPDVPYDYSEFGGYHVKDTVGYDMATLEFYSSNDTAWIFAVKNQKPWFGMFDSNSKEQLFEWKSSSGLESDYRWSILCNPFKVGDKFVCFMKIASELYKPFLLTGESAIPLKEQEVNLGNESYFFARGLGENILVYHPHFYGGLYSPEGVEIINSVTFHEDPESGNEYLSGFKNDKVWLGIYENGKLQEEYIGKNAYDRNIRIDKGYGEYEEYFVKALSFGYSSALLKTEWGYVFYPRCKDSESGGYIHDMFFCRGGKMIPVFVGKYGLDIRNWYDNSILEYTGKEYIIYSTEGEVIFTQDVKNDHNGNVFTGIGTIYPVSYTEFLSIRVWSIWPNTKSSLRIRRYAFDSFVSTPVWDKELDYVFRGDSRISWVLLDNQSSIWQYRIDILNYDGSSQRIKFSVDINTGDIKYL